MKSIIQRQCPALIVLLFGCLLQISCSHGSYTSPESYDLNRPVKMQLGKVLNEISGLSFNKNNNAILAISDSKPKVIQIDLKSNKLKDYTGAVVPPKQDLEDIVKLDSNLYLLASRGVIYSVPIYTKNNAGIKTFAFRPEEVNEFETLYYDSAANGLMMLCKNCAGDKGAKAHSAFRFDLTSNTFDAMPYYLIDVKAVRAVLKDKNAEFKPSAAAIHPIEKRLYILASVGKLLVIADTYGKVQEVHKLNPDIYRQPEGITFAPNGDMFISNEAKGLVPTLLYFPYHVSNKQTNEEDEKE